MTPTQSDCINCKHLIDFFSEPATCKAFPKGISWDILDGEIKHDKHISGQVGDYVFELKQDGEPQELGEI